MPGPSHVTDVRIAALLADVPAYAQWQADPLDPQLEQLLDDADAQTLMTLAAEALMRLIDT